MSVVITHQLVGGGASELPSLYYSYCLHKEFRHLYTRDKLHDSRNYIDKMSTEVLYQLNLSNTALLTNFQDRNNIWRYMASTGTRASYEGNNPVKLQPNISFCRESTG